MQPISETTSTVVHCAILSTSSLFLPACTLVFQDQQSASAEDALACSRCSHNSRLNLTRMIHTSSTSKEDVFFHGENHLLTDGVVSVVADYETHDALTNVLCFAMVTDFIATWTLISLVLVFVKKVTLFYPLAFFVFFDFINRVFWGATFAR